MWTLYRTQNKYIFDLIISTKCSTFIKPTQNKFPRTNLNLCDIFCKCDETVKGNIFPIFHYIVFPPKLISWIVWFTEKSGTRTQSRQIEIINFFQIEFPGWVFHPHSPQRQQQPPGKVAKKETTFKGNLGENGRVVVALYDPNKMETIQFEEKQENW